MNRGNFANGVGETAAYNNRGQMSSIVEMKGTNLLFSKSYGFYDGSNRNNGNVLSITDGISTTKNQTYTYDALNRIKTALQTDGAINIAFSIDAWGNMTESGTQNVSGPFDQNNRFQTGSYDAAGNMLQTGGHNYAYDAENRIKTVDTTAATYTYWPDGSRARKDAGTNSTEYLYFGGNILAESNPTTHAWTDYIFAGGKRIAKDTSTNGTAAQYYHGDHLGTARIMTDNTGTKISDCTYAPFGEQINCSPDNTSNHYRFTSQERDETQLDFFGARYYSSGLGRFVTPDWAAKPVPVPYANFANPQSLNLYSYVSNNPTGLSDANGHCDILTCIQIGIGVATGVIRDGGVKPYLKNVATGTAKGAGTFAVKTAQIASAGVSSNPANVVAAVLDPGPKALQPSNKHRLRPRS